MKVKGIAQVEHVGGFELKGTRRPLAAYNVIHRVTYHELLADTTLLNDDGRSCRVGQRCADI